MEYHDSFDNYFVGGKNYYDCTIFYFFKIKTFGFRMVYFIFYLMFFMKLNIDSPIDENNVYFCNQIIF